jgi:hypothetical protein
MRFPFEAHQGNRIPFQSNIPGRTFRNPPHPENATHYSAKNRVASSQALDATLAQGVSPTAGRKGTSPSAAPMTTMATPQVENGQRKRP